MILYEYVKLTKQSNKSKESKTDNIYTVLETNVIYMSSLANQTVIEHDIHRFLISLCVC